MFITKKHINRRTFLRGMGVTLALPFLESMVPAQTALRGTAANPGSRVGFIYNAHGAHMVDWTPAVEGTAWEFTPILSPLTPFRDRLLIVSGLEVPLVGPPPGAASGAGIHPRAAAAWLSGSAPKKTAGIDVRNGTTADQIIAQRIGQETPLPSIELGIEDVGSLGVCGHGYNCAYANTVSWQTSTRPLPMEINPQSVFERLFGDGSTPEQRRSRKSLDGSILDSITQDVAHFQKEIPATDRVRLNQYLEDIREIERRLQLIGKNAAVLPVQDVPVGVPQSFEEHVKLMLDLQVLAFQANITRVFSMMFAREQSKAVYPESGVTTANHSASHHGFDPKRMKEWAAINRYHVQMLAHFLDRLKSSPDGDGSLLDHSMILYGSSLSTGHIHDYYPVPALIAGGGAGQIQGGRHVKFANKPPVSNLLLAMINKLGIPMDTFGDSTGILEV